MYSLRIKGVPYDRWRLISCKECEERARYLSSREKRKKIGRKEKKKKKSFVLHSCKTGILDSWRHFCLSVWMVASLDKKLVPAKR